MRNEQLKTAKSNYYGKNWRESTDFRVVVMNGKRQVKKILGQVLQIHVCRKRDA